MNKRIAFIPSNQQQNLKTAILSQIILNSEINKDFALLSRLKVRQGQVICNNQHSI